MTCIIRVIHRPDELVGQYLKSFDFDAFGGQGHGVFTRHRDQAKVFRDVAEAWEFWGTTSKVKPLREDGKPNRPLTATTVEILKLGEKP